MKWEALETVLLISSIVPTSLWLPIFMIQIYELFRMVRDISRLNVSRIMTKDPDNSRKQDNFLIEKRQQDKLRWKEEREINIAYQIKERRCFNFFTIVTTILFMILNVAVFSPIPIYDGHYK